MVDTIKPSPHPSVQAHRTLTVQQVWRNVELVIAVRRNPVFAGSDSGYAVLAHQTADATVANDQADLSGHPQFRKGGSLRQRMGCRPKPVRYSLPGTVQQMTRFNCMG